MSNLTPTGKRWQELYTAALTGAAGHAWSQSLAPDLIVATAAQVASRALALETEKLWPKVAGSAHIEMAKYSLRQWASAEVDRLKGVEIGATPAHVAPQHALWLLDYIADLERALEGRGPA